MYEYFLVPNSSTVLRSDGAYIPLVPLNTDYQAYMQWLSAGNIPAPLPSSAVRQ